MRLVKAVNGGSESTLRLKTSGEILRDGTVVELTRSSATPKKGITLISWKGHLLHTGREISHNRRIYEPIELDPSISGAIRLPTRVAPPEPTRKLFDDNHALFREYTGQLETCTKLLIAGIFMSWLSPVLSMVPLIWIFAPAGSPKNQLLQLLAVLCRRPLPLVGLTRGDLRSLPMWLRPSLLLDEPDLRPATLSILLASGRRGSYIRSGSDLVDLYGPKFICSQHLPYDTALQTDALRISLSPAARQVKPLDRETEEQIAEEFQARFLGYYLRNCCGFRIPDFDVSHLTLPVQGLARALGAAVVGDRKLQTEILQLLGSQDEENRADLAGTFDSFVIEGVLFFAHQKGWFQVRAAKVAEQVAAIYKGRGFDRAVSAESIGWALRRLRIPSSRLDRMANGVELSDSTCRFVHRLAISYGVRALQGRFQDGCRYCDELKKESPHSKTRAAAS